MLTEEQRKLLTEEVLEECWHKYSRQIDENEWWCTKCEKIVGYNRTFDTGNDLLDLKEALVKKGYWFRFRNYAHCEWFEIEDDKPSTFEDYLIDKDRFPKLVAEFMVVGLQIQEAIYELRKLRAALENMGG